MKNTGTTERLLTKIQHHVVTSSKLPLPRAPIREIFADFTLTPLATGMQAYVYRIEDTNYVLKEGRWDLDIPVTSKTNIRIHPTMAGLILNTVSYPFLPTEQEVARQFKLFNILRQYFGYAHTDKHPTFKTSATLLRKQKAVRVNLPAMFHEIQDEYKIQMKRELHDILLGDNVKHPNTLTKSNFLPDEVLLYGESIHPKQSGKQTFYIVQEFVDGQRMADIKPDTQPENIKSKLYLFAYLVLYMHMETSYVPDLRPRHLASPKEWFTGTDNIVITEDDVRFIDTRLLWNTEDKPIQRGLIIPDLNLGAVKHFLRDA